VFSLTVVASSAVTNNKKKTVEVAASEGKMWGIETSAEMLHLIVGIISNTLFVDVAKYF